MYYLLLILKTHFIDWRYFAKNELLETRFLFDDQQHHVPNQFSGKVAWQSPSNIALVKYWGKHGNQLPSNPSISFTLDACNTQTEIRFKKSDQFGFKFFFEGNENPKFGTKALNFLENNKAYFPFINQLELEIDTKNTFPHSSGIASSASGMSALALGLMSIEKQLNPFIEKDYFLQKASFLARLGSGSASRSVYGGLVNWGMHKDIENSSDLFAVAYQNNVHEVYSTFKDAVLLVDEGQKKVSSTVGHGLLKNHPFAQTRFDLAHTHLSQLLGALKTGDLKVFGDIVEREALMLHALMMTSDPYFILMKPNTLAIIEAIWEARQGGMDVWFTLDAGANVHLLYPAHEEHKVSIFVKETLAEYCAERKFIFDAVGLGPTQLY